MEALSQSLQPYKELVGSVASYVTIAQFFSGAFVCKDIYKRGSTQGCSPMPFIGGVTIAILMLKYGLVVNDSAMITVNVAAIFLNSVYSLFFYKYAADKYEDVLKPVAYGVATLAVFLGYAQLENPQNLEYRFGLVLTLLMLALIGAPLLDVKTIIANQDASSIPLPITLMGAIVTFLWLIYGIILLNVFMIIQNCIGFILCMVQLGLLFKYPGRISSSDGQSKKKKPAKKEQ